MERCWKELCQDVGSDLWDKGYKLVIRKLGGWGATVTVLVAKTISGIVDALFSTNQFRTKEAVARPIPEVLEFSEEELVNNYRASGVDGIPAEILRVIAYSYSQLLLCAEFMLGCRGVPISMEEIAAGFDQQGQR